MKALLILSTTFITLNSMAINFKDKSGILEKLNNFMGTQKYEEAFHVGERANYLYEICNTSDNHVECESSQYDVEVSNVNNLEATLVSNDPSDEGTIVSKRTWDKYQGNFIQVTLDNSSMLQEVSSFHNYMENDEAPSEYEVIGYDYQVVEHLGEQRDAMVVFGMLKWKDGFEALLTFKLVRGMTYISTFSSYEINLFGFAKVTTSLREYDSNENL